jgi:hypothetical protein
MANRYDRIIKENFNGLTIPLVYRMMDIENIQVIRLPRKIQRTLEREMDTLLRVKPKSGNEFILNVEWQSTNDTEMCRRMLLYHSITHAVYKLPVKGLVIYMGEEKMNMPAVITDENIHFTYKQIDLMDMDPDEFLKSDIPEEIILAVLAGKTKKGEKTPAIQQILFKLRTLLAGNQPELARKIAQLEILGELRVDAQKIIKREEEHMAFTYNLKNDIRYKEGQEQASVERNTTFVLNLLKRTDHSDRKIASLANVPLDFVRKVKTQNL